MMMDNHCFMPMERVLHVVSLTLDFTISVSLALLCQLVLKTARLPNQLRRGLATNSSVSPFSAVVFIQMLW